MKLTRRAAAFLLALMLSVSVVLPALAAAKDITKGLISSLVLVSCKSGNETRKGTGIVVGKLSDPKNSVIVVDPWVIFDKVTDVNESKVENVTVTVRGKKYQEECVNVGGVLGLIFPKQCYSVISPVVMLSPSLMPEGMPIMQAYNNGADKILSHNGEYLSVQEDGAHVGHFANDDLNRIQADPWKSRGTAIVTKVDDIYLLMGMVTSVVPSSNWVFFNDVTDIARLLGMYNIDADIEGEIEPDPIVSVAPVQVDMVYQQLQAREAAISQEQLTQTIILVVAGIVIVAAIVVLVLLLLRRKQGGAAPAGKAAFVLVGMTGALSGQTFPVVGDVIIGRSGACHVKFDQNTPGVSSEHCQVSVKGGKLYLMDKGSSYGTLDKRGNKIPAHQPIELMKGDAFFLATKDNGFMVK